MIPEVTFADEHERPILNGHKRATLRYHGEDLPLIGDPFKLVKPNGDWIATAVCRERGYESIEWIAKYGIEGHRDYLGAEECIDHLKQYYPKAELDSETCLNIVYWGDLLETPMEY